MSNYIEIQRVRLKVQLKKIVMNIKFPCSLTAQIKHGNYFLIQTQFMIAKNYMN